MKFIRSIAVIQSIYIITTAMWPIIDIHSFMLVTGHKTDVWLVKTVSLLLVANGLVIGAFIFLKENYKTVTMLGFLTAVALFSIDVYYTSLEVISDVYLADGVAEMIIAALWIYGYWQCGIDMSRIHNYKKR